MIGNLTALGVGVQRTAYGNRRLFEVGLSARHRTDPEDYDFYYGAPTKPVISDVTSQYKDRLDSLLGRKASTFSSFYAESGSLVGTVHLTPYLVSISQKESGAYEVVIGGRTSVIESAKSSSWTNGFENGDNHLYSCLNILKSDISNTVASVLGQNHWIKWD